MIHKISTLRIAFFKSIHSFEHSFSVMVMLFVILWSCSSSGYAESGSSRIWVGTWSTAPQLVEPGNMPPSPGLNDNTLRQVVRVSIGGDSLRVRFSNEFSTGTVTMKAVHVAISTGGSSIETTTNKELKFNGNAEVTMNPGVVISSDPVAFVLKPRMDIAITISFGQTSPDVTGHPGSRTTSYLLAGNNTSIIDFTCSVHTDHWYVINGIDVKTDKPSAAVAILGNSITDGRGSGTNRQNRWPDILSECLLKNPKTSQVGVLNLGIGGNCVLRNCLGPSGLSRFNRDILKQQGVRWIIILEGINDIGQTPDSVVASQVAIDLIAAYRQMIQDAHAQGFKVYGATILPFKKSFYYTDYREAARNTVNAWIRTSGNFDAVIDFDKAMRDSTNSLSILPVAQSGDYLHPNEAGYKMMGEAIDVSLFE
jgi:lysophospholipase L1-like esterase